MPKKTTKRTKTKSTKKYDLISALDGSIIQTYSNDDTKNVEKRIAIQKDAARAFGRTTLKHRLKLLKKIKKEFALEAENFTERARRETGKPLPEIYGGEIIANLELFDFYIKHSERFLEPEPVPINKLNYPGKSGFIKHRPLGVVGVLSSWNYPVALAIRAIVPAIVAGNAIAFKPSEQAASTGDLIAEVFQRHLPDHVFELFHGQKETNIAIVNNVNKVNFIGSVATGRAIASLCGENLIPCSTELSGKDATIVLADADIERATNGVIWGAFTNTGQNCASIERLFVHKDIAENFIAILVDKIKRLRLADDIGPLRNENQLKLVEKHIKEATAKGGAKILVGGNRVKGTLFYEPTVIEVKNLNLTLMQDETFGPTLPLVVVDDFEQAIHLANDSKYGLSMSIWTKNIKEAQKRADELEVGVVIINNCVFTGALASAPWGGVKQTGSGVTNSKYGLYEMTRPMLVLVDKNKKPKEPWWYPYNQNVIELMRALVKVNSGKPLSLLKALPLLNKVLKEKL